MLRATKLLMALLAAVVVGVAGASAVLGTTDPPSPPGPAELEPDGTGAAIVATAPDPDGGSTAAAASRSASASAGTAAPRWAVRVYRSEAGLTCPDANRTVGGDFGRVDGDGTFHALALDATGDCADLTADHPYELVVRHFEANAERGARAIVFGVANGGVVSIALTTDGATRNVPIVDGAYVAAITEDQAGASSVTFTLADGTHETHALRSDPMVGTTP